MGEKMTPSIRRALEWFENHEPIGSFPCDGKAPSLSLVKRLEKAGLVEAVGRERGMFGFVRFARTATGRTALTRED